MGLAKKGGESSSFLFFSIGSMSTSALRARVEMSRGGNFLFRYGTFNHTFPSPGKIDL